MNRSMIALTVLASLGCVGPGTAADTRVSIPFHGKGGIDSWYAVNDSLIYLKSRSGDWYRAELAGPCSGLSFATAIGYEQEASGSFDSRSTILVDGQRCPLVKLEKSAGPTPKKKLLRKKSSDSIGGAHRRGRFL
jgi:Family of unknown function (DUF6491)